MPSLVKIARIGKAHGLHGLNRIHFLSNYSSLLEQVDFERVQLFLKKNKPSKAQVNFNFIHLQHVTNRYHASHYNGQYLFLRYEDIPLKRDSIYMCHAEQCIIIDINKKNIGRVIDIVAWTHYDIIVMEDRQGKKMYLPSKLISVNVSSKTLALLQDIQT